MSIKRWLTITAICVAAASCQNPGQEPVPVDPPQEEESGEDNGDQPEEVQSYNGLVKQLRKATKGKGLDIVIMGDGYTEDLHESGRYETHMKTACEHLFSVEPMHSLADYFNVYYVGVVSETTKLEGNTALKVRGLSTGSESSDTESIIDSYGSRVEGIAVDSTVFVVILNSTKGGGWCTHASYLTQKSYAYCPRISSAPNSDDYRLALVHEAFGHGFAKMGDEYTMSGYNSRTPSKKDMQDLDYAHKHGYDLNITYSRDTLSCPWKDFLKDERYADERIGFFEGTGYFGRGSYRPTDKNLMNVTEGKDVQFSAPGRRIIYDRIIKRGEGRTPDYEEFVKFDKSL